MARNDQRHMGERLKEAKDERRYAVAFHCVNALQHTAAWRLERWFGVNATRKAGRQKRVSWEENDHDRYRA